MLRVVIKGVRGEGVLDDDDLDVLMVEVEVNFGQLLRSIFGNGLESIFGNGISNSMVVVLLKLQVNNILEDDDLDVLMVEVEVEILFIRLNQLIKSIFGDGNFKLFVL